MKYVLALDQGTTSSRALLFDQNGSVRAVAQREFDQIFPQPGWVEHDPAQIAFSQIAVACEALELGGASAQDVAAIGIAKPASPFTTRSSGKIVAPPISASAFGAMATGR